MTTATMSPDVRRVWAALDARVEDLVTLAVDLGSLPSPHGEEQAVADAVAAWLRGAGLRSWTQPITATSANAVGLLPGSGRGSAPSLLLNAHLDTGPPLPADAPDRLRRIHGAWVENDLIHGFGVVNDKGQLAATMIAAAAVAASDVELAGDLWVTGVACETGPYPDRLDADLSRPGEGFGAWWLLNRGVTADYALVAETSAFGIIDVECGAVRLRIELTGRDVYTPRRVRGDDPRTDPSAVVRLGALIPAVESWAVTYERATRRPRGGATLAPRVQIVDVTADPGAAAAVVDVRLLPGASPRRTATELAAHLDGAGLTCDVQVLQWSRGHEADGAAPLVAALAGAHGDLFGAPPGPPPDAEISMWRDTNVFNEAGIPALCYGPPRHPEPYSDPGDRAVRVEDLLAAAKVYAATAITVCGGGS